MAETWRDIARPIVAAAIKKSGHLPYKELKRAVSKAYPFGEREYHPYKIWLNEVQRQLTVHFNMPPIRIKDLNKNQLGLFA